MVPGFALCDALIAAVMRRMEREGLRRMHDLEDLRTGFEWNAEGGPHAHKPEGNRPDGSKPDGDKPVIA